MISVLVTGATGFVGSHILEAMNGRPGVRVIAACRDATRLPPSFHGEVRQGDLMDPAYQASLPEGVDAICHAAAWTSAWKHKKTSRIRFLEPTISLIDRASAAGVRRQIFLSSTSVAAPYASKDPMSRADDRRLGFWPHLQNVARIENHMRRSAGSGRQMVSLRVGTFVGRRYGIGVLSMLAPRLKSHLVPWVNGGRTHIPLVAGDDIGRAFLAAATSDLPMGYQAFNIVGPHSPTMREFIGFLSREYGLPMPHFGVPFAIAYPFARLMELMDAFVPWEPLVTRSIIHLIEETGATNGRATRILGYEPRIDWKSAVRDQMAEMKTRRAPMKMARPQ